MATRTGTGRLSFTIPATSTNYAPEVLVCGFGYGGLLDAIDALRVLVEGALPAGATIRIELLGAGLDPAVAGNWFDSGLTATAQGVFPNGTNGSQPFWLAGWRGVRLRAQSGGTAGSANVSASWETP